MSAGLVGLAVLVVAGGVVAVAGRDSRVVVAGLALAMGVAPLVADPSPAPLPLVARLAGAALAAYVLWIVLREGLPARGSAVGWPADALIAGACAIAGVAAAARLVVGGAAGLEPTAIDAAGGARGVPAALGAGFALAALAIGPLLAGRDVVRLGSGLLLAIHAGVLVRAGLVGPPPPLEQLATSGLVAVLGAAIAALASGALRSTGALDLISGRAAGAHRVGARRVGLGGAPGGATGSALQVPGAVVRRRVDRQARPPALPPAGVGSKDGLAEDDAEPDPALGWAEGAGADPPRLAEPPAEPADDADGEVDGAPEPAPRPAGLRSPIGPRSAGTRRIPGR